jgi:hypothetical protein
MQLAGSRRYSIEPHHPPACGNSCPVLPTIRGTVPARIVGGVRLQPDLYCVEFTARIPLNAYR